MTYCKWCGMDSSHPAKCSWCGRELVKQASHPTSAPVVTSQEKIAALDEEERRARNNFLITAGVILSLAVVVIFIRYQLFPAVWMVTLFVTGFLMVRMGVVDAFEDDWLTTFILILIAMTFPSLFAFIAYMAYGIIAKNLDHTMAWILGVSMSMAVVLEIAAILGGPDHFRVSVLMLLKGLEVTGLGAMIVGWIVSSSMSTNR